MPTPIRAPTTFSPAAIASATRGVSAPVLSEVATALAASCMPFDQANTSAASTTSTTNAVCTRLSSR